VITGSFIIALFVYVYLIMDEWTNKQLTIQKGEVRSIYQRRARNHSDPLLKILGVIQINDIYTHQVSSIMYKYNAKMLSINFIKYFTEDSAVHVHNTRSADVSTEEGGGRLIAKRQGKQSSLRFLTDGTHFKFRCNFHGINLRRYMFRKLRWRMHI